MQFGIIDISLLLVYAMFDHVSSLPCITGPDPACYLRFFCFVFVLPLCMIHAVLVRLESINLLLLLL